MKYKQNLKRSSSKNGKINVQLPRFSHFNQEKDQIKFLISVNELT